MNTSLRPLLCRSSLLPGESLLSYLSRLAAANCYNPASILTRLCNKHLFSLGLRDNLERPEHPETFDMLATLTGLPPRELANASAHRFAQSPILTEVAGPIIHLSDGYPFQLVSTFTRLRRFLRAEWAQFCPDCLEEATYHRLAWMLQDVSGCLKHQCLLVDHCQNCHSRVHIQDLVRCQCSQCGANLAGMATDGMQMEPLGLFAQRTIQVWWGLDAPAAAEATWTLPKQPVISLHRLFDRLMDSIEAIWSHTNRFVQTVSDRHMVQSLALKALADWPQGFCDFLRECLEHEVRRYSYQYACDCSAPIYLTRGSSFAFWVCGFQQLSGLSFVQEAVDRFLAENDVQVYSGYRYTRIRVQVDEDIQKITRRIAQRRWEQFPALIELP